jgi:hypothetical protein
VLGLPVRIHVAETTIAREHIRDAAFERGVLAIPINVTGSQIDNGAPGRVPVGCFGRALEKLEAEEQGGDDEKDETRHDFSSLAAEWPNFPSSIG